MRKGCVRKTVIFFVDIKEAYLDQCQASKMKYFVKIVNH